MHITQPENVHGDACIVAHFTFGQIFLYLNNFGQFWRNMIILYMTKDIFEMFSLIIHMHIHNKYLLLIFIIASVYLKKILKNDSFLPKICEDI